MMSFKHNNMKDLATKLEKVCATYTDPDVVVAVEGMQGTFVDLPAIAKLKERYGFTLFVDKAHSMFALGPRGRGVADHFGIDLSVIDVHIATLGKTLAAVGGFVAASKSVLDRVSSKSLYFAFRRPRVPHHPRRPRLVYPAPRRTPHPSP
ncbi:pyridoxal phosphate-dependent transferase, partial [Zopfochytrium polystomum]